MKKELFLTLSFIAITPQMTKTGNDYSVLVGFAAFAIAGYGIYYWRNQPQEQPNPHNNVPDKNPQENQDRPQLDLTDFQQNQENQIDLTSIQTNQEKPTIDELINSFSNIENPQIDQNKPQPNFIDLKKDPNKKPTLTNFTNPQDRPINNLLEPWDQIKQESPSQSDLSDLQQPKKTSTFQINTQNLKKMLTNDKQFKSVLNQLLNGQFD